MIEIDIGPNMFSSGVFVLSWHGFFSFIAVATAVYLVGRWATLQNILSDDIYSIAVWAIVGGVIGARLVHIIDQWDGYYQHNPGAIIEIWRGGIGVWGGILGGYLGGVTGASLMNRYRFGRRARLSRKIRQVKDDEQRQGLEEEISRNQHLPIGIIADLTAPALLFAQTIGRIGDIVNGEHCAKATDLFLGFIWTHTNSAANGCANGVGISVQPVIAYEMLWNMFALFIIWNLRGRIKPDGMLFVLYLALYSVGRFAVSFAREDKIWGLGMQEAHYIAILIICLTIPLLIFKARWISSDVAAAIPGSGSQESRPEIGTRAERRRQGRRS